MYRRLDTQEQTSVISQLNISLLAYNSSHSVVLQHIASGLKL